MSAESFIGIALCLVSLLFLAALFDCQETACAEDCNTRGLDYRVSCMDTCVCQCVPYPEEGVTDGTGG